MSEEEKLLKEAKKLPWEDRLFHKNWKVRNEATIDLAALCDSISDPKDPLIREFGPSMIAYLRAADANAGSDSCGVHVLPWLKMWDGTEGDDGYTMPYYSDDELHQLKIGVL